MKTWLNALVVVIGLGLALGLYVLLTKKKVGAATLGSHPTLPGTGVGDNSTAFPGNPAYQSNDVIANDCPTLGPVLYGPRQLCPDGNTVAVGTGCKGGGAPYGPPSKVCPDGSSVGADSSCPDSGVDPVGEDFVFVAP